MTGNKLMWHLDRLNDWHKNKDIVPLHIDMGITTGCNAACEFCFGLEMSRTNASKRFDMPLDAIRNLFDDCKSEGVKSITLSGEGENTLNPAFYDAIQYAKNINLDIGVATNGTLIAGDRVKDLLQTLVYLRFNISAATSRSYKRIHGKDFFETVISNIKKCVSVKKEFGLPVTIGMQMVVTKHNYDDIIPLSSIGEKLGVDYLVIKPCSDTPDRTLNVPHKEYKTLYDKFKSAESNSSDDYSVIIKFNKFDNAGVNAYKTCYGTAFMIAINGRGDVAPCGHLLTPKMKDKFHMGNIIEERLRNIVHSNKYRDIQKKVRSLDVNSECETNCKQYNINMFLEQLKNPPRHINFP